MRRGATGGFTLLEVVAAIALLSALTVAALPLLVDATRCAVPPKDAADASELRAFSDSVMLDDDTLARIDAGAEVRLAWRGVSDRTAVVARRVEDVTSAGASTPHEWVEFRCGEVRVLRDRKVAPPSAPAAEESPP